MFIDSHCHLDCLDLSPYQNDIGVFLKHQRDAGLDHMLCVSIGLEKFAKMTDFVGINEMVSFSVGVHPNEVSEIESTEMDIVNLATSVKNVVAVGETGLDFFHADVDREVQIARLRTHIQAARKLNLPLIIHSREAIDDILAILKEERAEEVGGVFHCFTENWESACRILDIGFYVSFSGILTFKNAFDIQDVAKKIPLDKFLIETDSPYLAPAPYRGKQNYPCYVRYVAEFMARLRMMDIEHIAYHSSNNFNMLFGAAT